MSHDATQARERKSWPIIAGISVCVFVICGTFFTWLAIASVEKTRSDGGTAPLILAGLIPVISALAFSALLSLASVRLFGERIPQRFRKPPFSVYVFGVLAIAFWLITNFRTLLYSLDLLSPDSPHLREANGVFVSSFPSVSMSAFVGALFVSFAGYLFFHAGRTRGHLIAAIILLTYGIWELIGLAGKLL